MKIGEYKQAMSHMLKKDNSLENFSFNPDAKLIDNDPAPTYPFKNGGKVIIGRPGGIANPNQNYYGKWVELDENKLIDLYNKGITPFAISKQLGVSNKSISNRIEKLINENRLTDRIPSTHITRSELANKLNIQVPALEKAKAANTPLWQTIEKYLNVKNFGTSGEFYKNPNAEELRQIKNKSGDLGRSAPRNIYGGKESVIGKIRNMLNESEEPLTIKDIHKELLGITPTTAEDYDAGIKAAWNNLKNDKNYKNKIINVPDEERVINFSKTMGNKIAPIINNVRDTFVNDPEASLEDVARNMYGTKFDKASPIQKEEMARDASASTMKFLESVTTGRKVPGFKDIDPDTLGDIIENIESKTSEFGVNANDVRNYRFNVADELRGFDPNTTSKLRKKLVGSGRHVDEAVGLAATFKNAPGYLEATQFLKASTNSEKGKQIDKYFSNILPKALDGSASKEDINEYNKRARIFKTKNPNVDVPFIRTGDNLDPRDYIKHFDDFTPESQNNILKLAEDNGVVIQTQAKPIGKIFEDMQDAKNTKDKISQASKFKKLGLTSEQGALYSDILGLGALAETGAARRLGNLVANASRVTGAPINAAFGAVLNAEDIREKGFNVPETLALGAGKGMTDDLLNFISYAYRAPIALGKTILDKPFNEQTDFDFEKFKQNLGEDPVNIAGYVIDKLEKSKNIKDKVDNMVNFYWEKTQKPATVDDTGINPMEWSAPNMPIVSEEDKNKQLNLIRKEFFKLNPGLENEYYKAYKEQNIQEPNITTTGLFNANIQDTSEPQELADGGRVKLEGGGGPKMGRRGFLGLLVGAAAAAPELLKTIKGTSQVAKVASKIKLESAEGMYSWFPNLVEKIKKVGTPSEETERIMEASYKYEPRGYGGLPKGEEKITKHVDGDTTFILREYPDGRIAVDIHSPRNSEGLDTPITLYYRPKMELQYHTGKKVDPAEFKVLEKEPRYFANGPDDVDIEMSEKVKTPGRDTIFGDVEAAERFATGDIQNRKIIKTKQSIRDQMTDDPNEFIQERNPYVDYDIPEEITHD
jgi:hypothetical protein